MSTVWLGAASRAIPSKADSKRSLSRPRRTMRYLLGPTGLAPVLLGRTGSCCRRVAMIGVFLGLADGPGGVDQADMAEGLREVADHLTAGHVDLLGQQADVVDRRHGPLEGRRGLVHLAGQRLRLGQPERAEQEG